MGRKTSPRNHRYFKFLPWLLLILLAAAPPLSAQQGRQISLDISPNPVGRGDRFGVTIVAEIEDPSMIDVTQPDLSEDIVLLRGPYVRPVWSEEGDGEERRQTEITYLYRCDATGRFEIGSYRIITPRRIFSTEPTLLEVGVYRNRQLVVPLELRWDAQPSSAYVGQNVICILKALEQRDIRIFDDTVIQSPSEGFFQAAEGIGEIRRYTRGGISLYEIPIETFVFTPSSPGPVTLPAARVNWEEGEAVSSRTVIDVQPLPQAVQQSGAVGRFEITADIDRTELETGQRVGLTVRVRGTGNLNYLQFPEIEAPAFSIMEQDEEADYTASVDGYRGWRQYTYTLLAEEPGPANILVKSLTAFDPVERRVYFSPGRSFPMQVLSPQGRTDEGPDPDRFQFSLIPAGEMEQVNMSLRYSSWVEYLWLLPGPIVFLVFFLLKRRKAVLTVLLLLFLSFNPVDFTSDGLTDTLVSAERHYSEKNYVAAEALYEELIARQPHVPALYYNAAISAYQQGKIGRAVLHTRTAQELQPMEQEYRRFLGFLDAQYGIVTQVDTPFPFHPDFFLFLLIFGINAAGFLGVLYLFKRRNSYFIGALLLVVASFVNVIGMTYAVHASNRTTAVVMQGNGEVYAVQKIPKAGSEADFVLQPGETLHIKGDADDFYFITTSLGQKGWIKKSSVRIVPGLVEMANRTGGQL